MNFCCFKCLKFTSNKNIKRKREIGRKNNLHSYCYFKKFKTFESLKVDQEKLNDLLKILNCT